MAPQMSDGTEDDDSLDKDADGALDTDADAGVCSRLVRLFASRASGEPLRFLTPRELLELCDDLTRSQESNEISVQS